MEKNVERVNNVKRKFVVCGCGILFIYVIYKTFILNGSNTLEKCLTNEIALENVYYITQIIAAFCVVIGAFIGVWQYVLTTRAERSKLNTECIQKAIDLSEYYKDNILEKYKMIRYVFDETGMTNIIKQVNKNNIKNFDEMELENLIPEAQRQQIASIKKSDAFIRAVLQAEKIYDINLNIEENTTFSEGEDGVEISIDRNAVIRKFMGRIVSDTLNNLEYFSMNFTHGTADETVVYQSLHQTYLEIVYMLYYNVAITNKANKSKYFTNVIELYRKWNTRSINDSRKRSDSLRSVTTKGNVVDKY